MTDILGDSGDYDYLHDGVELSKDVEGMCLEIGLRLGLGTKTIIDAVAEFCPKKVVVSIDPYGSILYEGREGQICRLDYTNPMRNECLGNMFPYSQEKDVQWKFIELTDDDFFKLYKNGVIIYDLERKVCNEYSFVHFDGPHNIKAITSEINFFYKRTNKGGIWAFDDVTPDFYDHDIIENYLFKLGVELIKKGLKKALYRKL